MEVEAQAARLALGLWLLGRGYATSVLAPVDRLALIHRPPIFALLHAPMLLCILEIEHINVHASYGTERGQVSLPFLPA